jgi:hypothetical protein
MRLFLLLLAAASLAAAGPHVFGPSGEVTFRLHDPLAHPFIWWPRTLLEYPVEFTSPATPDHLTLWDENGAAVPFQLSHVKLHASKLESATLCFFSDLPSGGTHQFVLKAGTPPAARQLVHETADHDSIILDSGKLNVRIPATQSNPASAPGPIMQLSRGNAWIGNSKLIPGSARLLKITSTRVESGPLFITWRIEYEFAPRGRYRATVRALADTEFVEFFEEMEDLSGARVETSWTGFRPEYRQAPNHPYQPGHDIGDPAEPIDMAQMNTHIAVAPGISSSGELPFRLGMYQPWPAFSVGTFANFWNNHSSDALGVFIDKLERWDDRDYSIWSSSDKLQVRYFWRDNNLSWTWPLESGTRSTCLSFYDHALDRQAVEAMVRSHAGVRGSDGIRYASALQPTSHMLFLQNRHGVLDLNRVKDWVLEYPENARRPELPFKQGRHNTAAELERAVMASELMDEVAVSGTRQNGGFGPVPSRQVGDRWVDGYVRLYSTLTPRQRERLTAAFLLMAYTHAGEDYMPMRPMLSGHPNFLSDVKSVPALMSSLFPEHPMAREWADLFRKYMELNTHYHTRPEVEEWNARGGRWTENLGTYVWGFVRPALRANYMLEQFDGGNRFPTPELALVGDHLVNALSAPYDGEPDEWVRAARDVHFWGMVTKQNGPRRVHPPQGAHAARRMPPRSMWLLGKLLERYSPLTAEHLMWAARPGDQDLELPLDAPDPWSVMFSGPENRGTDPHLTSAKYTGYGIVLRAGVGTKNELSIHLQQIDDGPNYRWGVQPDSGTGAIYFFAGGKAYSHNGIEDTGDRAMQDTDLQTNFGAWKDGKFRSLGRNVLDRPLYNLDIAQFAELASSSYSKPEYLGRSILLVGQDYFVTFDDVFNEAVAHRFSWFTGRWEDLPFIQIVRGSGRNPEGLKTDIQTSTTKGVWYDGLGDTLAIVSHRRDLQVEPRKYGAAVTVDGGHDLVFRDNDGVNVHEGDVAFEGKAGVVRKRSGGRIELALIHGTRISAGGLSLSTADPELGISAGFSTLAEIAGVYSARRPSRVRIEPVNGTLYIDGARQTLTGNELALPKGTHHWQITNGDPVPLAPNILRTENVAGGARIFVEQVAGATSYTYEISRDNGVTWTAASATLTGLPNGTKIHVRAIARNATHSSAPGPEYPVYITSKPPLPPDGLSIALRNGGAILTWGEVLGVREYRLYAGSKLVYAGPLHSFTDPHAAAEYCVSAVNVNGEGPRSLTVSTSSRWLTFDPRPAEPFRRAPVEQLYYPK